MTVTQTPPSITTIKVVPIQPSILEGGFLYPAHFGPKKAINVVRYAPLLLVNPIVSGDVKIPSLLTCTTGSWDGSPAPLYTFQWKVDGVDIPGEISSTMTTDITQDGTFISCMVTATNTQGFLSQISNSLGVSRVEPIIVDEMDYYSITGQSDPLNINLDVINFYPITGYASIDHQSHFEDSYFIITGAGSEDHNTNFEYTSYIVTGSNQEDHQNTMEVDGYGITMFEVIQVLTLFNPGAELGAMTNWTTTSGTMQAVTIAAAYGAGDTDPYAGTYFFSGGDESAFDAVYQDIAVPGGLETDIDADMLFIGLDWYQASYNDEDEAHLYISFYNGAAALISTNTMLGSFSVPRNSWDNYFSGMVEIPALTRTIRIHMDMTRGGGTENNAYIDDISITVYGIVSNV